MYIEHDGKSSLLSGEDLAYCAAFVYTVLVGLDPWWFLQRQRRSPGPLAPAQERQCRAGGPQRGAETGQQKARSVESACSPKGRLDRVGHPLEGVPRRARTLARSGVVWRGRPEPAKNSAMPEPLASATTIRGGVGGTPRRNAHGGVLRGGDLRPDPVPLARLPSGPQRSAEGKAALGTRGGNLLAARHRAPQPGRSPVRREARRLGAERMVPPTLPDRALQGT